MCVTMVTSTPRRRRTRPRRRVFGAVRLGPVALSHKCRRCRRCLQSKSPRLLVENRLEHRLVISSSYLYVVASCTRLTIYLHTCTIIRVTRVHVRTYNNVKVISDMMYSQIRACVSNNRQHNTTQCRDNDNILKCVCCYAPLYTL